MQQIRNRYSTPPQESSGELARQFRGLSRPLRDAADLDPLLDRVGDARVVMLGEASHGTSEYYTWRTRISQRLIEEKGFSFIAVEGDWPDCYAVNAYVKARPDSAASAREVLLGYDRWPTWMWANREVVDLTEWLRRHNDQLPREARAGFYGLDVYSLWDSLEAVARFLEDSRPESLDAARRAFRCFEPYWEDEQGYGYATALVPTSCEDDAVAMLRSLCEEAGAFRRADPEGFFDAEQNALIARNAEMYYRTMVRGGAASWNVRDHHMMDTLDRLLSHYGPGAKAIVWEHNTHIGDARATDMAGAGMVNVGQLARERYGVEDVVLAGFGSHRGAVIAADRWSGDIQRMPVPPAWTGSHEHAMHEAGEDAALMVFADRADLGALLEPRGHRAIGVVYDPARERWGNYVPTILPLRYDAFVYLEETHALHPLHAEPPPGRELETFPSAV